MTALTRNRNTPEFAELRDVSIPVAAGVQIFKGALVCRNAAGDAVPGANVAGYRFAGVAREKADNRLGTAGAMAIVVRRLGVHNYISSGLTKADAGKPFFVVDDQTVTLTPGLVPCGFMAQYDSATVAPVDIRPATYETADIQSYPVAAATTIVAGTMVCLNTSGYLVPAANTPGYKFKGIAKESIDNSAGLDGDLDCRVQRDGIHNLVGAGLTVTDADKPLWISNATTITTTPGYVFAGMLSRYQSATVAPVDIAPATKTPGTGQLFTIPAFRAGTVGASEVTVRSSREASRAFRVLRGYGDTRVAPGGSYVLTVKITDGTTPKTFTITGAATHGEDKDIDQVYPANTDINITMQDDNASSASEDINAEFECEYL